MIEQLIKTKTANQYSTMLKSLILTNHPMNVGR
jgi:hypothetical protein